MRNKKPTLPGKSRAEVTSNDERKAIHAAWRGNGGTMTWSQLETAFGLRPTNGMTAYHIASDYEKALVAAGIPLPPRVKAPAIARVLITPAPAPLAIIPYVAAAQVA